MSSKEYCRFYHIDAGEPQCWKAVHRYKHIDLIFRCLCEGEEWRCDLKKFGTDENNKKEN